MEDVYLVGMWNSHRKYKMFSFIILMLKSSVDEVSRVTSYFILIHLKTVMFPSIVSYPSRHLSAKELLLEL